MQLPKENSSYRAYIRFGRYLARRLKRAGKEQLAKDILANIDAVRNAGRAWEDTEDAQQDALADRDGADDTLDLRAQEARNQLAGRSLRANEEEPYTLIFPSGIDYYLLAPLSEERSRYEEFATRLEQHLPAGDALRKSTVKAVRAGIDDFEAATKALETADQQRALARTTLDRTVRSFTKQCEKAYGLLYAEVGKASAERYFPRVRAARAADSPSPEPAPEG